MIKIDFLKYGPHLKIKTENQKQYIYDPIRQKYLVLQPEELVRQTVLHYMIEELGYPKKRIQVEKMVPNHHVTKRFDIIVYGKSGNPQLLIECKSYKEKINQKVFEQISAYNLALKVDYLLITNGLETHLCQMDYHKETYHFLKEIPDKSTFD